MKWRVIHVSLLSILGHRHHVTFEPEHDALVKLTHRRFPAFKIT